MCARSGSRVLAGLVDLHPSRVAHCTSTGGSCAFLQNPGICSLNSTDMTYIPGSQFLFYYICRNNRFVSHQPVFTLPTRQNFNFVASFPLRRELSENGTHNRLQRGVRSLICKQSYIHLKPKSRLRLQREDQGAEFRTCLGRSWIPASRSLKREANVCGNASSLIGA